jgi:hypothetical protein
MSRLLSPLVPQNLRDMLEDYPEHVERMREVPDPVPVRFSPAADPPGRAIWSSKAESDLRRRSQRRCAKYSRAAARADIPVLSDLQVHQAFGISNERTSLKLKEGLLSTLDTIHVRTNTPIRLCDSGVDPLLREQDSYAAIDGCGGGEAIGRRSGKS